MTIHATNSPAAKRALALVRKAALALDGVSERASHGAPSFFVAIGSTGKQTRCFVMFADSHHHDGRLAIWCAAGDGIQRMLVETRPRDFFVPPYVGVSGWLGVHLNQGIDDDEIARIIASAHATVVEKYPAPAAKAAATPPKKKSAREARARR